MKFPLMPVMAVALFVVGFMTGRWSAPASSTPAPSPSTAPVASAPTSAPRPMQAAPPSGGLTGVIAELQQVPNYTYLRLATSSGEEWAAITSNSSLTVGQQVTIAESTRMTDFTSKSLGKTFPSIVFGELAGNAAAAPPSGTQQLPPGHPNTQASSATPIAKVLDSAKQNEPPLSLRVMDVFAERQALEGHLVKIHGTVKRVTEVQGVHYAHVVDGSGSTATKDDDLVVMSSTALQAEQTVTLQGRVVLNKDVGIGAWPVALESATVQ